MKNIIISVLLLLVIGCIPEKYSVSPDGKIAFYQGSSIYITDKDVSFLKEIRLDEDGKMIWIEWSPDGKQLICVYSDNPDTDNEMSRVYIIDHDGKNKMKIIDRKGLVILPEWSPDKKYISYTAAGNLYIYEIASGKNRLVVEDTGMMYKWLPDSKRVIGKKERESRLLNEIIVVDADSHERTTLVRGFFATLMALDYHPASQSVIFSSGATSLPEAPETLSKYYIFSVNINDKSIKRITDDRYPSYQTDESSFAISIRLL